MRHVALFLLVTLPKPLSKAKVMLLRLKATALHIYPVPVLLILTAKQQKNFVMPGLNLLVNR